MPDIARWNGMDQLSEKFISSSPYAYVMNNPVSFFDPDGRDMAPSTGNWLQDMWNATDSYSYWSNNGSGSFVRGDDGSGMTHENYTNFYNFLAGGGTGNYTYWTNSTAQPTDGYAYDGHRIKISSNENWFKPFSDTVNDGLESFLNHLYVEFGGKLTMGSYFDASLKNGIGANIGERSTVADFWYIKDAGKELADYGAGSYYRGEKVELTIGGAYGGAVSYNLTNEGANSIVIGLLGFGYTRTWGGSAPANNFIGLDTGVSAGIGLGGGINIKTGIKW